MYLSPNTATCIQTIISRKAMTIILNADYSWILTK